MSRRTDQIDSTTAPPAQAGGAILSPSDAAYLASLAPATPSAYHRLNPLTTYQELPRERVFEMRLNFLF